MKPSPLDVEAVARVLKEKGKATAYQIAMDLQWFKPVTTAARAPDTYRVVGAIIALQRQGRVVEDGKDLGGTTVWLWVV